MAKDKLTKKDKQKPEKNVQQKVPEEKSKPTSGIWQDERFQHLVSDPRFRSLPKQQRKVKIDKRFQGMFTNDKFKVKYTVDKYGRRVNKSNSEDLKKYYELDSSAEESEGEEEQQGKQKLQETEREDEHSEDSASEDHEDEEREREEKAITQQDSDVDENDDLISDGEEVPKTLRERLVDPDIDYARGEGRLITDSSSDDESSEDEDPEMYIDHVWGELANDADTTEDSTTRLAVCNMDWDRVRAVDLMVLFSSFLPPGGAVLSVKIYPSEFGKQRFKEEELHGPPELVGLGKEALKQNGRSKKQEEDDSSDDSGSEDELVQEQDSDAGEGDDYHMEKLRQYQLNRLRYYYAVVECDTVATADKIYQECDGIEYESSATKVDLRFIPEDTTFDEDEPTDVCNELPNANSYQPRQFTTTALQQAKVDLTWDETAVDRKELGDKLSAGKLEGISDRDLRKIVAYSSEEEEEEEEADEEDNESEQEAAKKNSKQEAKEANKEKQKPKKKSNKKEEVINKYKALLTEINEKEEKEKQKKKYEMEFSWDVSNDKSNPFKDDDQAEADNKKQQQNLTPIEKVLQKRNEKNKKRKEERKKKKSQTNGQDAESELDSLPDDIDMNDPYFAEEFANGDFIDPKVQRKEKQKKQKQLKAEQEEEDEKQAKELELLLDDHEEQDGKQHFSLDKILKSEQDSKTKKKRRKQLKKSKAAIEEAQKPVEDNFKLDINDQRFKAVFTSHEFNIDPTNPNFKKTKAMEDLIHEKIKRRHGDNKTNSEHKSEIESEESVSKRPRQHVENSLLVKNLKRKIQMKQEGK